MKICIDVGNTTIRMGLLSPKLCERFSCDTYNADDKYHDDCFERYFKKELLNGSQVSHIIYSSVVPSIDDKIKTRISKFCPNAEWINVSIYMEHDFQIVVDDENEIGSDLFADLVGANDEYGYPVIIIDIGTATKILLLDKNNVFSTCVILPGIELSAKTLTSNTALLPSFGINNVTKLIDGHNTVTCLVNGVIYGQVEAIKGIVNRYESELGYSCKKVVTGGASVYVKELFPGDYIIDDDLNMKGLTVLLNKNIKG